MMKRIIFYIYISLILSNCFCTDNSKIDIENKRLEIKENDCGYEINLGKDNIIRLINNITDTTQLILQDNKFINLDFYIIPPYLTSAYLSEVKEIGDLLILESFPVGASGHSANIVNVSIIFLDNLTYGKVMSYNSFYAGIELLKYKENKLFLEIFDYFRIDDKNKRLFCKTNFEITLEAIIQQKNMKNCFVFKDGKFFEYNECNCVPLESPYVLPTGRQYRGVCP